MVDKRDNKDGIAAAVDRRRVVRNVDDLRGGMIVGEDKTKICEMLLPVLQHTRNLSDLADLKYEKRIDGFEVVTATYTNGFSREVNVSLDSGTAMISDIIRQIV